MMKNRLFLLLTAGVVKRLARFAITVLIVVPLYGEVGVRECIAPAAAPGTAYRLAPDSVWRDVGTLRFNNNGASDYVISIIAEFTAGNTANRLVEYQITVDGVVAGTFTRRTPEVFPNTQLMRAVASGLADGIHTIALRARNLSAQQVLYGRVWITPLLVDAAENTVRNSSGVALTVTSSWTNLAQVNIAAGSTKMLYLVASATVTGGTSLTNVQYRLTSANVIDTYDDTVPDVMSDGVHVAAMYKPPTTSSATYWFQARTLGGPFTVGARELVAQTMPHFTLFEATGGAATIPNNGSWHTLTTSTVPSLPAAARGLYGSDGSGYTYFTYNSAKTYAEVRFELETPYPDPYKFWEVGWIGLQPSGYRKLEGIMADWEQLGLDVGLPFTMRLQMRGLCPGGPSLSVTKSRFQVAVIPDSYAFTGTSCSANPSVCCANNPGVCQAYECSMALPLTTGVPSGSCP
jgi:hypothetical protein